MKRCKNCYQDISHRVKPGPGAPPRYCAKEDNLFCFRDRQNARQQASCGQRPRKLDYDSIPYELDLTRMWIAGDRELAEHLAHEVRDTLLGRIEGCPARELPTLTSRSTLDDGSEAPEGELPASHAKVIRLDDPREQQDGEEWGLAA